MYSTTNKIKQFQDFLQVIQAVKKPALLASILLLSNTVVQALPLYDDIIKGKPRYPGVYLGTIKLYPAPVRVYDNDKTKLTYDPSNGANGTYWVRRFEEVKDDKAVVCPSNRKQNCKFYFNTTITYTKYKTKFLAFILRDKVPYYGAYHPKSTVYDLVNVTNDFNSQKYTDPGAVITDPLTVNVELKPGQRAVPIAYAYVKYINDRGDFSKCDIKCYLRHGITGYTEVNEYGNAKPAYPTHKLGWWKGNVYANWNRGMCILNKNTPSPKPGDAVKNKCIGWNDPEIAIGKWPSRLPNLPYLEANSSAELTYGLELFAFEH